MDLLDRISVLAFTSHMLCVTVYWVSPLILSFQVLIVILRMIAVLMMITAMISWDIVQISRSVPANIAIRCGSSYLCFFYCERRREDPFYILFERSDTLFTLFWWYSFEILFERLHVRDYTFWWNLFHRFLCLWVIYLLK